MPQKKVYGNVFKTQAVKLGREVSFSKADLEPGTQPLDTAMSLAEEVQKLRQ